MLLMAYGALNAHRRARGKENRGEEDRRKEETLLLNF
jgi:hypothetical protein